MKHGNDRAQGQEPSGEADARVGGHDAAGEFDSAREAAEDSLAAGRLDDAAAAFGRALELRPDDVPTLIDLAHTTFVRGDADSALAHLRRAAELDPRGVGALRSAIEMHRRAGRLDDALDAALAVVDRRPGDVSATLEVAELSLAQDRLDHAADAFARLRRIDGEPGHDVYACHGLVAVELRRGEWLRALDSAIEAGRVDRHRRTTDVIAFTAARVFGPSDRTIPSSDEIERLLADSLAEHRALHVEPLAF
jgi:tetratricopeptide (TPR) repeat protein